MAGRYSLYNPVRRLFYADLHGLFNKPILNTALVNLSLISNLTSVLESELIFYRYCLHLYIIIRLLFIIRRIFSLAA